MRSDFFDFQKHFLYLCREYIHASDHKHVIRTAGNILHTYRCSAAFTRFIHQACQVSGTISDKRKGFFAKAGYNQFPQFSRRKHFLCLRIDDLRYKPVFIHMHSTQLRTFSRNPWTAQFAHSVILRTEEILAPDFVHLVPHSFCHPFASEETDMKFKIFFRVKSSPSDLLAKMKCI